MEIYTKNDNRIAFLEIIGGLTIIVFWIGWFLDILKPIDSTHASYDVYVAFETSFPLPDTWIVGLLFMSAIGVWKQQPFGAYLGVAAGGALIFLGLIDSSFYIQHNLYQHDLLLIPINFACISGGSLLIFWFGRQNSQ